MELEKCTLPSMFKELHKSNVFRLYCVLLRNSMYYNWGFEGQSNCIVHGFSFVFLKVLWLKVQGWDIIDGNTVNFVYG